MWGIEYRSWHSDRWYPVINGEFATKKLADEWIKYLGESYSLGLMRPVWLGE